MPCWTDVKMGFAASVVATKDRSAEEKSERTGMWARKTTRQCLEEDGVMSEEEYIEINESWHEILFEGLCAFWLAFLLVCTTIFFLPFIAGYAAYRQFRYAIPVPQNEVRERAHLG